MLLVRIDWGNIRKSNKRFGISDETDQIGRDDPEMVIVKRGVGMWLMTGERSGVLLKHNVQV